VIGRASRPGVDKLADELERSSRPRANLRVELDFMNFREPQSPEQQMKNHPLIVKRILKTSPFRRDLIEHRFPQERRTLFLPS